MDLVLGETRPRTCFWKSCTRVPSSRCFGRGPEWSASRVCESLLALSVPSPQVGGYISDSSTLSWKSPKRHGPTCVLCLWPLSFSWFCSRHTESQGHSLTSYERGYGNEHSLIRGISQLAYPRCYFGPPLLTTGTLEFIGQFESATAHDGGEVLCGDGICECAERESCERRSCDMSCRVR